MVADYLRFMDAIFPQPKCSMLELLKIIVKYSNNPNSKQYRGASCNFVVRMKYTELAIESVAMQIKNLPKGKYTKKVYDIAGKRVGEDAVQLYLKYKELQGREDLWKNLHEHMLKRCNS